LQLTFERADEETFSLLKLARYAATQGGTFTTVLNAANESAVRLFLEEKIRFTDIFHIVEEKVLSHRPLETEDLSEILALDLETKQRVLEQYQNGI
jgi:1-deoxy-D-xylulose-5-phosphate reductoisomerase